MIHLRTIRIKKTHNLKWIPVSKKAEKNDSFMKENWQGGQIVIFLSLERNQTIYLSA